jgi:SAM-dependent methyltransferase
LPKWARRLPEPVKVLGRGIRRAYGVTTMNLGRIRSTAPLSMNWGYDRGTPIDRYYIERFLAAHASDVKGRVLEIQEDDYSRRFGSDRISRQDILNVDASNPRATIIGDLANPATLPAGQFDCILLTQTLHLVFDMPAAIANLHRALRPGGVLLITVPGITPLDRVEFLDSWYWSLTGPALQRLLTGPFSPEDVEVEAHGNLYAATAFLHAAAVEEVSRRKLDRFDRAYPVTIAARAVA